MIEADIRGYSGLYKINTNGHVYSYPKRWISGKGVVKQHNGKRLKAGISYNGYRIITLRKNGIKKTFRINRLVAKHFIKNPQNKPHVNHKNGNKLEDRVKNLEWNTVSENVLHAYANGLRSNPKGEKSHFSKITELQATKIKNSKYSREVLAKKYGISIRTVRGIQTGKRWTHLK
jgi:hypothetical protein